MMKRRDKTEVEFRFVNQDGVWYWDITWKVRGKKLGAIPGCTPSLPLPDINLDKCSTLKECFNAISQKRGEDWIGEVYADAMACERMRTQ